MIHCINILHADFHLDHFPNSIFAVIYLICGRATYRGEYNTHILNSFWVFKQIICWVKLGNNCTVFIFVDINYRLDSCKFEFSGAFLAGKKRE